MSKDTLMEKIKEGKTVLGVHINDPDMVELCDQLGFEWFQIDQMFSSIDWEKAHDLLRTGAATEITPVIRVQSNPRDWV